MGISVMLGIVGYLAAGMFNDSVVSVAPIFWILLGVGAALNTINRRADRNVKVNDDYIPEIPAAEKSVDPEQQRQAADAAEILAATIRADYENKQAEREERRMSCTHTQEDISSLLESVRAIKTVEDKQREEAEKQAGSTQANPAKENSDDNG